MDILLTGGTGYIGHTILKQLVGRGHGVTAVVRSETSARTVESGGATAVRGDLLDVGWLTQRLAAADGAIHVASPGDASSAAVDTAVATAAAAAFSGTTRPYIHTGGVWVYGDGTDITEDTPFAAPELVSWRAAVESIVLEADLPGSIVVPGIVYGQGRGIPTMLGSAPRTEDGTLTVLGDGHQHWSTVHVEDLAALYVAVLESGTAQGYILGVSGVNPTVRELGEAIAGGAVAPEGVEATRERLGAMFADVLLLDQQAFPAKATALGWAPVRPTLVEELRDASGRQFAER